jgi:hypothetical protein
MRSMVEGAATSTGPISPHAGENGISWAWPFATSWKFQEGDFAGHETSNVDAQKQKAPDGRLRSSHR